jgi:hypothetical protein
MQINVIGTIMFVLALSLVLGQQLVTRARSRPA